MRDYVILALLAVTLLMALRHAWIGAIAWTVVSLAAPHEYFGFAAKAWPVSMYVAVVTILATLWSKERQNPFKFPVICLYLVLLIWQTIGLPFSFVPEYCYDLHDRTLKITLMLILTVALIDTRKKLDVFIWANALSIGFYGFKGGLFTILTAGNATVWGPGGFIFENNGMALANATIAPWFYYIQQGLKKRWLRVAAGVTMLMVVVAALGSQSRGAMLAVSCMGLYFWIKSKQKAAWGLVIVAAVLAALMLMPESYWARMNTIKSYDEDLSAQGRINAWWAAFNIANDRFTGGGFRTNISWVFERYAPNPKLLFVEHSIYFQMLGEFGWLGLFMFLGLGAMTWRNASQMIRIGKTAPELQWAFFMGTTVQVSMVAYGVAGAFLSLALFDLPYNVMAIAALGLHFARREQAALLAAASRPPEAPSRPMPEATRRSPEGPTIPSRPLTGR